MLSRELPRRLQEHTEVVLGTPEGGVEAESADICLVGAVILAPAVVENPKVGPVVGIGRVQVGGQQEMGLRLLVSTQFPQGVGQVEVQGRFIGQVSGWWGMEKERRYSASVGLWDNYSIGEIQ